MVEDAKSANGSGPSGSSASGSGSGSKKDSSTSRSSQSNSKSKSSSSKTGSSSTPKHPQSPAGRVSSSPKQTSSSFHSTANSSRSSRFGTGKGANKLSVVENPDSTVNEEDQTAVLQAKQDAARLKTLRKKQEFKQYLVDKHVVDSFLKLYVLRFVGAEIRRDTCQLAWRRLRVGFLGPRTVPLDGAGIYVIGNPGL